MARAFSGTTQNMTTADTTALRPAFPMSVSLWAFGAAQGTFKYLASKPLLATQHPSYGLSTDGSSQLRFGIGWGTTAGNVTVSPSTSSTPFTSVWRHILGTYDGAFVRLYVDGTQVGTGTAETRAISYNTNGLFFGSFDATTLYFAGNLAEVAVMSAVPDAAQIDALRKAYTPPLVMGTAVEGYWPLVGRYSPEIDLVGGSAMTITSATTADHPRVFHSVPFQAAPAPAGGATLTGGASLTGTATITATAAVLRPADAAPTVTATLTATTTAVTPAQASLTTTGTITAAAAVLTPAAASLTGTATLTAAAAVGAGSALTVAGTITATTAVVTPAQASLTTTAAVTPAAALTAAVQVTLAASAGLTAAGNVPSTWGPPTGLTATPISQSQIDLAWNPMVGASGYDVERDGAVIATDVTATAYSDTGLAAATTHTYRVRSVHA